MNIRPVVLDGRFARLEPLSPEHHEALCRVGLDESLWQWTHARITTPAAMREYMDEALRQQDEGAAQPFVIRENGGQIVGSTRYGAIDRGNRRVEIGWTWVGTAWQRTPINTNAKYLLLGHAFESLGCIRVEFKTDVLNEKSRAALQRIGAREEGVARRHMITASGRVRDTIWFSVIREEWPAVKAALEARLDA